MYRKVKGVWIWEDEDEVWAVVADLEAFQAAIVAEGLDPVSVAQVDVEVGVGVTLEDMAMLVVLVPDIDDEALAA